MSGLRLLSICLLDAKLVDNVLLEVREGVALGNLKLLLLAGESDINGKLDVVALVNLGSALSIRDFLLEEFPEKHGCLEFLQAHLGHQ